MLSRGIVTDNGLTGVNEALMSMKRVDTALQSSLPLEGLAEAIATEAARIVPIDTGALCSSIRWQKIDKNTVEIYAGDPGNVDYAAFVEFGTYKMDPQPYMRPAVDSQIKQYGFHGYVQTLVNKAI
jgi:HK97 gp10 family phage protein